MTQVSTIAVSLDPATYAKLEAEAAKAGVSVHDLAVKKLGGHPDKADDWLGDFGASTAPPASGSKAKAGTK